MPHFWTTRAKMTLPRGRVPFLEWDRERMPFMLNQVGMPPPSRNIQRRRPEVEPETDGATEESAPGNAILVSILACVAVLIVGLVIGWLVL